MTSGFASAIAVAVFFSNFLLAALPISQKRRVSQGEPFRSFRILDEKLTLLADQQSSLKKALAAGRVNSPTRSLASGSVKTILTQMNSTIGGIAHIANRLEHLYQRRRQPFAVRTFRILHRRAQTVQREIRSVQAPIPHDLNLAQNRLDKDIVALMVQFQAVTAGSTGTHCQPRAHICCQPKRSQDLLSGEQVACKWVCVSRPQACAGILGPRIPQSSRGVD